MTETESLLIDYYNKFNEEKRFDSRHGQVEYQVTMRYILDYLDSLDGKRESISILDIGAGTGRYAIPLAEIGYDVSAIELVKHNVSRLKQKCDKVKAIQGNALNLKKYEDNSFDLVLLFGPMYHLFNDEDKAKALSEAKRVAKPGARIMVAYCMNEYALVVYGLKEGHLGQSIIEGKIDSNFHVRNANKDLYDFVRIEDINRLNGMVKLDREFMFAPDGPANYVRQALKKLTDEEFEMFINYQFMVSKRTDLLGASAHTVDVLKV